MERKRKPASAHARWTEEQDTILADAMAKQIIHGKTTKNGFSKQAWSLVRTEFNKKTGCNYDKHQLRNRKGVLMTQYQILKRMLEHPGFSWDETGHMVVAEDGVWDEYLKVHPEAEKLRNLCFPSFKQLCFIFRGLSTKSSFEKYSLNLTIKDDDTPPGTQQSAQEQADTNEPIAQDKDSTHLAEDPNIKDERKKRRSISPSPSDSIRCTRRGSGATKLAEAVFEFADSMRFKTLASTPTGDPYAMGKCIKELEAIKDVTDEEVFGAINVFRDALSREAFMTMQPQRRLRWIRTQIN